MRLTGRGIGVGITAALLYGVGAFLGYPLLRALAAAAALALVLAGLSTLAPVRAMVRRTAYPERVERGRSAEATLVARNATANRQLPFVAIDAIDLRPHPVRVRSLPAGGSATYRYPLPTSRRGKVVVGPVTVRRGDPLGLVTRDCTVDGTQVLWVHPRRHPARPAIGPRARHNHEGALLRLPLPGSMNQRSVREYLPGDEPRHLHWRATARMQRLMVRDYTDPAQPRCVVVLDTRETVMAPARFEDAVEVAASLGYAAIEHGQPTRLCTTTGLDLSVDSDPAGARVLLDRLCEVEQRPAVATSSLRELAAAGSGGWLVFVTAGTAHAACAAVAALRHRFALILIVDLADDPGADVAGVTVLRAQDAAEALRRWNAWVAQ